jgi:hypothetical protein
MNGLPGECLSCSKISLCQETSLRKIVSGYTCILYQAVADPIFSARESAIRDLGLMVSVRALLGDMRREDLTTMNEFRKYLDPENGTTVAQRAAVFDAIGFELVRYLGVTEYKLFTWNESLAQQSRPACRQKVLDHEVSIHKIIPDPNQVDTGASTMAQPFQPPMPGNFPMPPQQAPMPVQPPQAPQMPMPPPAGGFSPPPMQPQAAPPPPPPQPASAEQAATPAAAEAPAPAKRGRKPGGAAAAPPPPPPQGPQMIGGAPPTTGWAPPPGGWTPPQAPNQMVPAGPPQFAPPQPGGGFSPPQFQAPAAPPAAQPAAQVDLSEVLGKLQAATNMITAMGKEVEALRTHNQVILAGVWHLYTTVQPLMAQAAKNNYQVNTLANFEEWLKLSFPR